MAKLNYYIFFTVPGQVLAPAVNYYNLTELNITWSPLEDRRGGNVDYYNIKIENLNEEGAIISERLYNKSESKYIVNILYV